MTRLPGPGPIATARYSPRMIRQPYGLLPELHRRYGPVVAFGYPPFRYVYLFGRDANELLLHGETERFRWREALASLIPIDGDTALVVSDGDDHQRRRRLVQPAFARRRIEAYLPIMVDELAAEVSSWRPGEVVDVYATLRRRVLAAVIRSLFGEALRDRADELGHHLQVGIDYVNTSPLARFDHDWPGTPYRRAMRARRAADEIIYDEITRRRKAAGGGDRRDADAGDVLDALLAAQDDGRDRGEDDGLTDEEVRDQVVSLVAAGFETTSAGIGWTLHAVHARPDVAARLRAEVASVVGDGELTPAHLGAMPYLDAVVSESLRLHPPGPFSARKVVDDVTFAGHTIPAGVLVVYSAYEVQRDPAHWPEPDRFAPERWLPGDALHRPVDPYAYVPFGGGYRRCIGFALATQEIKAAMVEVVRRVDLRPLDRTLVPTGIATMWPRDGVRCEVGNPPK
jgi:cytochrome P450